MRRPSRSPGAASAWILVLCCLALSVAGFLGVRWLTQAPASEPLAEKRPVVTVGLAKVQPAAFHQTLALTGTVEAIDRLPVSSESTGLKIVAVLAEEGDTVRQGQILAQLDTSVLEARLAQLEARRVQQGALLAKAKQPLRSLEVAQLESAWQQAKAQVEQEKSNARLVQAALDNAEANASRYSQLYGQGAVAQTEQENRQLEVDRQRAQAQAASDRIRSAEFAARQARERLQLAKEGGRAEDVTVAEAQLQELQAQIQETRALIAQGRVIAPADGWVLRRQARLGDVAAAGKVLFELAKNGELELRGQLPEARLGAVKVGQQATIVHAGSSSSGTVWAISPQVDAASRQAEVRIRLPGSSGLRPGMFAEATLALGRVDSLSIPLQAVRGEDPESFVFVLDGTTARRRDVVVSERRDGQALVAQGVRSGEEVIVEGGGFLRDGDPVTRP